MAGAIDIGSVGEAYRFPAGRGRGQRIAIVEPRGGYHEADVRAAAGADHPSVTAHEVKATVNGLPLTGTNSPLDIATIGQILDALEQHPDAPTVAAEYAADQVWTTFMATVETSLDVELAVQLAPDADIDVWFTPTHASGLAAGIDRAVQTGATVISLSWGLSESAYGAADEPGLMGIEAALERASRAGVTVCCASGDYGSLNERSGGDGLARVNYPASSVWALACGATMSPLVPPSGGLGGRPPGPTEVVWNAVEFGLPHASGGGYSGLFPRPSFQSALPVSAMTDSWLGPSAGPGFTGRGVPDVAANAGPYDIVIGGRPFVAGGTSASAPIWAALLALVSEEIARPAGAITPLLYSSSGACCSSIDSGDDRLEGARRVFAATPGWDPCTGWGTPRGDDVVRAVRASATVADPLPPT